MAVSAGVAGPRLLPPVEHAGRATIVLRNVLDQPVTVRLRVDEADGGRLVNLLSQDTGEADERARHAVALEAYGYRRLRVGDSERPIPDQMPRRT